MVITSPHSSVSVFLNNVPSEACMSILKKAEINVACVQNGTVIQNALYLQLLFCAPYEFRLNNSLPLQLIQHELSQASVEQYCGFPFHFRLSLLSTTPALYSCMCCTPSPARSTGCSWQKLRHTVKSGRCPPGTTGTVQTR